jgi:hypothetical protein
METTPGQSEKLKRYLINADPFLWDVLKAKNKKNRIKELKELGFLEIYPGKSNPTYSKINQDLLIELGIEGIFEKIIKKQLDALFNVSHLVYFRRCWEQGQTPDMLYLKNEKLYRPKFFESDEKLEGGKITGYRSPAFIFFQINVQKDFIERWTTFAGLWFEEIEPIIEQKIL